MKIELWWTGKSKFSFVEEGTTLFVKRINRYYPFEIKTFPSVAKAKDSQVIKKKEAEQILKKITKDDILILLDENGKILTSRQFSKTFETWLNQGKQRIIFLIGGAYGFDEQLKNKALIKISLSSMTFSHQLIKLIFVEQLYRCCTIIRGENYHND